MQNYYKSKIIVVVVAVIFFSGCSLGDFSQKSEIEVQDTPDKKTKETSPVPENEPIIDQAVPSETDQSAETPDPKKTEISTPQNNAASTAPTTPLAVPSVKIIDRLVSWGFTASSGRAIDTIIIHSSYNAVGKDVHDLDDIIDREYKPAGVAPHYIIPRDGKIYRLVADKNIAYHAGVSKVPDGRTNVNDFSIGIEVVETKTESPNSVQYASLKSLINYLKGQYKIKYVLGHDDIAPSRKDDPWNFDWGKIK